MPTLRPVLAFPAPARLNEPLPTAAESLRFEMVGDGDAMRKLRAQVERIGPHFRTVLVRGEIGTGKEMVARAMHSKGAGGPFVVCHGASLGDAAVSADNDWLQSLMRSARRGTLFLDGIEEMPPTAQARLVAVLRKRSGQQQRMIVSASEDLRSLAAARRFRQDLYHRIAMVEVALVPLRERVDDIPSLAWHFLRRFTALYGRRIEAISEDAMERMMAHAWPGNVREMENVIRNGVLQSEGTVLKEHDLTSLRELKMEASVPVTAVPSRLQDVVEQHVQLVLKRCEGNKVRAAEFLGISRSTLYRMLESSSSQG
ncbi:sigma 54-interacting transcriptional regulator [Edaphobacter bradus]|uniref:sigma 54-interacting transcriptional regulator n=1 Tax=Edaphobacter bradus TaxID=2259016 RepID=UPI0021E0F3C3|nr:sigma 54-interacting transcriptional regulator [Edaphobacter bradus]